jgi:5-methylthioadenosine/S-adenosylhomocysteine deaminase
MSKTFDLGILCGKFLAMKDHSTNVSENIFMGIKNGQIAYVGGENKKGDCAEFVDATGKLVMPGLVNAHAHLPMHLFRGLADDEPFDVWLWKNILPLEAKLLSPEFVRLGTELSLLEAISFGITSIYDMYYFEDEIADVCDKAGMRALLGENFSSFPAPDDKDQKGNDLKIIEKMLEKYGTTHERIRPMISPHAPYTCTDEKLKAARDLALKTGLHIGVHVSETKGEQETSFKEFKKSPVQRFHDLGLSDAPCLYAHCVHVSDEDIALMKQKNVRVSHNPEANMKLGAGAAPVPKMLKAGLKVGIGTDSVASNNDFNLWKEMDFAAKLAKLSNSDNTAMTANDALKLATSLGAQAMGFDTTGQLREGFLADFLILDIEKVYLKPVHSIPSLLVYSANGSEVESTYCQGRLLYNKGSFKTLDRDSIISRSEKYIKEKF